MLFRSQILTSVLKKRNIKIELNANIEANLDFLKNIFDEKFSAQTKMEKIDGVIILFDEFSEFLLSKSNLSNGDDKSDSHLASTQLLAIADIIPKIDANISLITVGQEHLREINPLIAKTEEEGGRFKTLELKSTYLIDIINAKLYFDKRKYEKEIKTL